MSTNRGTQKSFLFCPYSLVEKTCQCLGVYTTLPTRLLSLLLLLLLLLLFLSLFCYYFIIVFFIIYINFIVIIIIYIVLFNTRNAYLNVMIDINTIIIVFLVCSGKYCLGSKYRLSLQGRCND